MGWITQQIGSIIDCRACGSQIQLQTPSDQFFNPPEPEFYSDLPPIYSSPFLIDPDYEVVRTLPVVTARRVYGSNIWKDFLIAVRDVAGGRSDTAEGLLAKIEAELLNDVQIQAQKAKANALVDLNLQFGEISGGKAQMFFGTAQATPVILSKPGGEE